MSLSATEQYLLELMNRARLDPAGEAARMGIDLNDGLRAGLISTASKQVLAPNALLEAAATGHSLWMLSADTFSHIGLNGTSAPVRIRAEGYTPSSSAENIALTGSTGSVSLLAQIEELNRDLFLSASHRLSLMNGTFREVGIGAETGIFTQGGVNYNAMTLTEDFGTSGTAHFLTGVAYGDTNNDKFYSIGEGLAGVVFNAAGLTASTAAAGGFTLALGSETAVAVTGQAGALTFSLKVDMSPGNVKLDLVSGTTFYASGSLELRTGVNNVLLLGSNVLNVKGNAAANALTGNGGNNYLNGLSGVDVLIGNAGADRLEGGAANDRLTGGTGADLMSGGLGADRFIFHNGDGDDRITDFSLANGDKLMLDDALWGGVTMKTAGIIAQFSARLPGEVVLDFGNGDVIHLVGLTTAAGLGALIEIF